MDSQRPEPSERAAARYPVVAIDDDPDDLFFITRRIHKSGARNPIMTFGDGDEAIRHFERVRENASFTAPASVIFCDIKMPRVSGFDVLRWFRRFPEFAPIRFAMLSGSNERIDHERAAELGANRYLVKFPPEQTFAEIIAEADAAIRATNGGLWRRSESAG